MKHSGQYVAWNRPRTVEWGRITSWKISTLMLMPQAWLEEASETSGTFHNGGCTTETEQEGARRGKTEKKALVSVVKGPNTNNGVTFFSVSISFIPSHLCPDIVKGFLLHIVLLADHMDNSLTIDLVFHYCTFRLKISLYCLPFYQHVLTPHLKKTSKESFKTSPFLLFLSLTASYCKGDKKTQEVRYIYMLSMCI